MFNSIFGTITQKLPQQLFLETGSEEAGFIEWALTVPDSSLETIANVGEKARVYTWSYHHEDAFKLFGFATASERSVFIDLMKVEGVGPKAAVKILSNINASALATVLDSSDLARLEKIPGIGKKTAQKMLLALKGKLAISEDTIVVRTKEASRWADVIIALTNMGYDKKEAEDLVNRIGEEIDETLGKKEAEDLLFRRAIVELAH